MGGLLLHLRRVFELPELLAASGPRLVNRLRVNRQEFAPHLEDFRKEKKR